MDADTLRRLLEDVAAGRVGVGDAVGRFGPAVAVLDYATVDLERRDRCGFPEVILAEGKTAAQVEGVARKLAEAGQSCLATRVSPAQADHLAAAFPTAEQDRVARTFWMPAGEQRPAVGKVVVVTAGTGDLPVAREALVTAGVMGAGVELVADVGVAGLHRLLRQRHRLDGADAVVAVAGMDGAMPSVIGGLVDCPVIAVPTSVGYGAAFGGVACLLTMLNSCSAGVTVVNIDAGFKAGYVAALIATRGRR